MTIDIHRRDLERVVGKFTWVEGKASTRILLDGSVRVDEAALLRLFPGYVARDRGHVLELVPEDEDG